MSIMSLDELGEWVRDEWPTRRLSDLIPLTFERCHPRLLVITGENASGKSVIRRILQELARDQKVEPIAISPELRQTGGLVTAFVYGDESTTASGDIAGGVIIGAINTSRKRTQPHIIILDEPDMGMSDNLAAGAAQELIEFCQDPPEHLGFVAVITHRKAMLSELFAGNAAHLRVGDALTCAEVLAQPVTPVRPAEVRERGHTLFRAIQQLLKD